MNDNYNIEGNDFKDYNLRFFYHMMSLEGNTINIDPVEFPPDMVLSMKHFIAIGLIAETARGPRNKITWTVTPDGESFWANNEDTIITILGL